MKHTFLFLLLILLLGLTACSKPADRTLVYSVVKTYQDLYQYLQQQPLLSDFTNYDATKGIKKRPHLINISGKLIEKQLQAYIVRNFFDEAGFYPIFQNDDITLKRAIKVLNEGKSFPTPENKNNTSNGIAQSQTNASRGYGLLKEIIHEDYIAGSLC